MSGWAEPKHRKSPNPLWGIDTFKQELSNGGGITEICKSYATAHTGWQGLYNDVRRWRTMDPDLQKLIDDNIKAMGRDPDTAKKAGRKRNDVKADDHDWRLAFVEEYMRTNSREKAALVTPYSATSILKMLHAGDTSYDKSLADMVGIAEQMIVNRASAAALDALDEAIQQGADAKTKAWIALGILKTHPKGWQQKMELNVTGSVKFELDRGRQVAELLADQQRYFQATRPLALVAGDVVDVEEVKQ